MSQKDKIFEYMKQEPGRKISTWIAYKNWNCTTLAQRIADLKKDYAFKSLIINGREYEIKDELVTRDGKTFSEYWLEPVQWSQNMETRLARNH